MKTIKFIIASLFVMLCFTVNAQKVVVYGTNGEVLGEYDADKVDRVEYQPVVKPTEPSKTIYYGAVLNDAEMIPYQEMLNFEGEEGEFNISFTIPRSQEYANLVQAWEEAGEEEDWELVDELDSQMEEYRDAHKYPYYLLLPTEILSKNIITIRNPFGTLIPFTQYRTEVIDGSEYVVLRYYTDLQRATEVNQTLKFKLNIKEQYNDETLSSATIYYGAVLNDNVSYAEMPNVSADGGIVDISFTIPGSQEYVNLEREMNDAYDEEDFELGEQKEIEMEEWRNNHKYPYYVIIPNSILEKFDIKITNELGVSRAFEVYGTDVINGSEYTVLRYYVKEFRASGNDVTYDYRIILTKK